MGGAPLRGPAPLRPPGPGGPGPQPNQNQVYIRSCKLFFFLHFTVLLEFFLNPL